MGSVQTTSPHSSDLKLAEILADYYGLNAEQTNAFFDRVVAGEKEFVAIGDFTRMGKDGIEPCMPEPSEKTLMETLLALLLPMGIDYVQREFAVVESRDMERWERYERIIRSTQRQLGLPAIGVYIDESDAGEDKPVCYLTGGEPGGNCDCYQCGLANQRRTGTSPEQAGNMEDEHRMSR